MFSLVLNGLVAFGLFFQLPAAAPQKATAPGSSATTTAGAESKHGSVDADTDTQSELLHVRRIFVESFGDDAVSKQVQAMVISSLTESKRFIVTENKDKADAFLKGSGGEKTSHEYHANEEGTAAGGVSPSLGVAAAIEDASASTETINDARIALRLVDKNGDIIWATAQESKGAKYKGAVADVADKVVKELLRAVKKLENKSTDPDSAK
jgi:curli biogenesis system outer membrane secretion channel CsgG